MKAEESIKLTKNGFEESFKQQDLYNRQTQSDEHLKKILNALKVNAGSSILDLGTGSGYLAFALAEKFKDCHITGLDIVEEALKFNRKKANDCGLNNLSFISYGGSVYPFINEKFDCITTRYALHHFPEIEKTFAEISRVLKQKGLFFISDPTPNPNDGSRFVDDYMQMKKDGHIKYYTKNEFTELAKNCGMVLRNYFETEICFPRLETAAIGFDEIMAKHSREITDGYKVQITEDRQFIYITQTVLNLLFEKI